MLEEMGHPYQIDKLLFIRENFFKQDDLLWHESEFYFLMKVDDINVFESSYGSLGAKEGKVWIPMN
ncbi:MAG: hypothetical protein M0Q94_02475 [Candidatus Cloacimonetes bacterium]|nr:hypothetical protein [Candidatus Cloacimonadota bacterium]